MESMVEINSTYFEQFKPLILKLPNSQERVHLAFVLLFDLVNCKAHNF